MIDAGVTTVKAIFEAAAAVRWDLIRSAFAADGALAGQAVRDKISSG